MLRIQDHGKQLWIAAVGLAFFSGMAVANGYATHEALHKAVSAVQGDCNWTIKHELERQRHILQSQ
jgi:hypothetical protein